MGNHSCPNSWVSTQYWSSRFARDGTNVSIGYSMPSTSPSTVVACGHGYMPHLSLKCLIVNHAIRFASSRSEEHTSELQSQSNLVCRLLLEKKKHGNRR